MSGWTKSPTRKKTLYYIFLLAFAVSSILPLLFFLYVLLDRGLMDYTRAGLFLVFGLSLALLSSLTIFLGPISSLLSTQYQTLKTGRLSQLLSLNFSTLCVPLSLTVNTKNNVFLDFCEDSDILIIIKKLFYIKF